MIDETHKQSDDDLSRGDSKYRYKYRDKYFKRAPAEEDVGEGDRDSRDSPDDEQAPAENPGKKEANGNQKEKSPSDKKREKRKKLLIFGSIAALFVILGTVWLLLYLIVFSKRQTTDDAYVGGDQVSVSAQIMGTVVEVLVDDTEPVHAGQVLARLDPSDPAADLLRAEALLAQAVRQVQQQIHNANQSDAVVAARQADVDRAADDYRRKQPLLAEHAAASEDIASSLQQLKAARAALDQAQRQARGTHALVDGVNVQNNPGVIQARAQYISAWVNNSRGTIVAPIDGYVAQREVQVGQQIQPGQRLLTIVPLDRLWIDANFKEGQLESIRIGQPVEVTADMYSSDVVFHGRVIGLAAGTGGAFSLLPPQNASGNWIKIVQRLPVRIGLDANELRAHPLRIGLSTYTKVDIHDRSGAMLATAPRKTPESTTSVYTQEFEQAASAADTIIQRNIVDSDLARVTH